MSGRQRNVVHSNITAGLEMLRTHALIREVVSFFGRDHPDIPLTILVRTLPEPERTLLKELAVKLEEWPGLPLKMVRREPWHTKVEEAILARVGQPHGFTVNALLYDAGIEEASIGCWTAARTYAEQILNTIRS